MHTHKPKIVFLAETRQCENKVKRMKWRLGFKHCLTQDGKGKGAGIALYWDDSIKIKVLSYGPRYFDVIVSEPHSPKWRGTFVYGVPKGQDRHLMWSQLQNIAPKSNEPWLMVGDFNETMWQHEHLSYEKRSERKMENFR